MKEALKYIGFGLGMLALFLVVVGIFTSGNSGLQLIVALVAVFAFGVYCGRASLKPSQTDPYWW